MDQSGVGTATARLLVLKAVEPVRARVPREGSVCVRRPAVQNGKRRVDADFKMAPALASRILWIHSRYPHDDLLGASCQFSSRFTEVAELRCLPHLYPMVHVDILPAAIRIQPQQLVLGHHVARRELDVHLDLC